MAKDQAQFRLRHPDHADRGDAGIYETDDPVESMNLQTRGYELLSDGVKSPARKSTGSSSSSSSDSGASGS